MTDVNETLELDESAERGEELDLSHPGMRWMDEAACKDLPQSDFFVEAGRVLPEEARAACMSCPVWRECLKWSYMALPDGKMITGGYFAGLSLGQRKRMTLEQAMRFAEEQRAAASSD